MNTRRTLDMACRIAGLDSKDAELVRLGENAIYRLRKEPVVVRIARTDAYLFDVQKEVAVARWLAEEGLPAVRLTGPDDQPLSIEGTVVTFWEYVPEHVVPPTVADLATLLRRLHSLPPPDGGHVKPLDPFHRIQERIQNADGIDASDRELLSSRLQDLRGRYPGLQLVLPACVIHRDASIGNVIHHVYGRVLLLDLDDFAIGPPEWDLALTATYYTTLGWHSGREYREFVDAYGFDVTRLPAFPLLRDIRELHMLSWLAQNVATNPSVAAEFRKRVRTIREGIVPRGWKPF